MVDVINGVPMPPYRKRGARTVYPWNVLLVGQCFQFPTHVAYNDARRMAYEAGRTYCMKFAVRVRDDHTCWCWRVADGYRGETRDPNKAMRIEVLEEPYEPQQGDAVTGYGEPDPDLPVREEPPDDPI